ncbi:glycosyltransferase family 4 protein [Pectobacterium punjabense]|uniref:glycosyltransferase family 4 protein n=1 Tax=Pectobacterium punjabense TaxID=2108399 RepID=UPI00196923FD|nr:glycosyltransferase family 4 protein [Pectobacterium punjabense]MBN3136692.1 glycosyltransferase family 4 protein [Pectobacterium punjabense]MCE5381122.1 glycosyltransferase family 4 protein [Pectobacterium punjabense]
MKILLIGNQSNTMLLFRGYLIEKLVAEGNEVVTLTMDCDYKIFERLKDIGAIPLQYDFSRSGMNPVYDGVNTIKLSKKIKKIKPHVVFCFFPKPVIFGAIASKLAGVRNIYLLLEGLGYCFTQRSVKDGLRERVLRSVQVFLYKMALPLAKKVLFLNADDYNDLILNNNIRIKDYEVVGGIGVDLNEYDYSEPDADNIVFLMVSRLLIDKGVKEFIHAARIVKKRYPNIQFSIAGACDDNPGGISLVELTKLKSEGIVNFLGQVSDIPSSLRKSSVFVLPSYREGIPRSTQEAMSIGRAVITTDVPGCRETVIDSVNGFLIPPWDSEILAKRMIFFIENPSKIYSMGLESRKIAEEKFDQEITCGRLMKILLSADFEFTKPTN